VNPVLIALATTVAILGIPVIVLGTIKVEPNPKVGTSRFDRVRSSYRRNFTRQRKILALVGVAAGIILWLISGWFILLIAVPVAAVGAPILLGKGTASNTIEKLEALETWTRSLSGLTIAGGTGLEQTIAASLSSTPVVILPQVTTLVARINARWSTKAALRRFANDLDDPTADLVVAHLLLADKSRGAGLANALDDLAESIFDEVKVRRQIEADRAKPRQNIRVITFITLGLLAVIPFLGQFMEPYSTPLGQLAITIWLFLYVLVLIWLKRITVGTPTPRILAAPNERGATK